MMKLHEQIKTSQNGETFLFQIAQHYVTCLPIIYFNLHIYTQHTILHVSITIRVNGSEKFVID